MPSDIIIEDSRIRLVDANRVDVEAGDGSALVDVEGRVHASERMYAEEVRARELRLGSSAGNEAVRGGQLTLLSPEGKNVFGARAGGTTQADVRIGDDGVAGKLRIESPNHGTASIIGGKVMGRTGQFDEVKGEKVTVGRAQGGEPQTHGVIEVVGSDGDILLNGVSLRGLLAQLDGRLRALGG